MQTSEGRAERLGALDGLFRESTQFTLENLGSVK